MSFSTGNSSQTAEINVTPLIDVLLVLLIIFMIIVPMKQPGLKVQSPPPAPSSPVPSPDTTIVLQVRAGAHGAATAYAINQQAIAKEAVVARLKEIFAARSERVMFVKGDPELEFSTIAEAIGMGRQADVQDIGMLTPGTEKTR